MTILEIDTYLQFNIFDFLETDGHYAVSESCKELNQTVKRYTKDQKFIVHSIDNQLNSIPYLDWCMSHPNFTKEKIYTYKAVLQSDIKMLRFLCKEKFPLTDRCWFAAACVEDLYIMSFLQRKEVPVHPMALECLATSNNKACFKFVLNSINEVLPTYQILDYMKCCIKKDKFENLEILVNKFKTLPCDALIKAIKYGAINCVKFIINWTILKSPWDFKHTGLQGFNKLSDKALNTAVTYNRLEIASYLLELGYCWSNLTSQISELKSWI